MVNVFLQLTEDPNLNVKLERYRVKDNLLLVSLTLPLRTKSSTVTVEWAILEMLRKLEIDKEKWDIINLPYIDSIAKETMHLHLVAPMIVPRQTCDHCTRTLVNMWTIGGDFKVWENPNEFWQRFSGKTIDKLPSKLIKYLNMEEIFGLSTPKKVSAGGCGSA
ncbi:hypothetical protein E1A91_A06G156900v1 [Gossypium mustelinum]|uniref:Uncharacterized protein n=1 Tax=Gossypium mustelinum TaxID=34275 RepID=A0A5D2YY60_GOSMU|nr:hypothetical protein E1A91_A06G156900v1 [Gossypium mustelinum]